jgi:hypothetical protein
VKENTAPKPKANSVDALVPSNRSARAMQTLPTEGLVIVQDEFIYTEEFLEIEGNKYSPIIIDEPPVMEESPVSLPDGSPRDTGGVSHTVISGPGRMEQPVDISFREKSLTIAASRMYRGRGISGMKGIIKLFLPGKLHLAIADVIHGMKLPNQSARSHAHGFLTKIGNVWAEEEKEQFLHRIALKGTPLDFASLMLNMEYKGFDAISALSHDSDNTVKLLKLCPNKVGLLNKTYGELFKTPMSVKVDKIRASKFNTKSLELDIMSMMSDNSLKMAINKISAAFHVEMPATYRRSIVQGHGQGHGVMPCGEGGSNVWENGIQEMPLGGRNGQRM